MGELGVQRVTEFQGGIGVRGWREVRGGMWLGKDGVRGSMGVQGGMELREGWGSGRDGVQGGMGVREG